MQRSIAVASILLLALSHSTGITIIRKHEDGSMQAVVTIRGEVITVAYADPERQARQISESSLLEEKRGQHGEDQEHQTQTDARKKKEMN